MYYSSFVRSAAVLVPKLLVVTLADPSHDCPELSADCSNESESHDHSENVLCADIESLSSTQVRGLSFPNTGPAASR